MPSRPMLLPAAELGFVVVGVGIVVVRILVDIGNFNVGSEVNISSKFVGLPTGDAKQVEVHNATYPVARPQLSAIS